MFYETVALHESVQRQREEERERESGTARGNLDLG